MVNRVRGGSVNPTTTKLDFYQEGPSSEMETGGPRWTKRRDRSHDWGNASGYCPSSLASKRELRNNVAELVLVGLRDD